MTKPGYLPNKPGAYPPSRSSSSGGTGAYAGIRGDATYTTLEPITESKLLLRYRLS